jgi:tRNA threonylcarbamoyladenosine biosynthesis protein TsaB
MPFKQCIAYEGSNHARLLPLYIDELLSLARAKQLTIDAVALSAGPGSYTGLRIGTATAKGLCYGLNIPLIPVSTLEVLCEAAKEKSANSQEPRAKSLLVPMIDARRMEVYTNVMMNGEWLNGEEAKAVVVESEESLRVKSEELRVKSEELRVKSEVYYFGDGAKKCQAVFTNPNWHYIPDIVPEARYVGQLVERQKSKVERVDIAYYEPYYLKEFVAAHSHVKGLV